MKYKNKTVKEIINSYKGFPSTSNTHKSLYKEIILCLTENKSERFGDKLIIFEKINEVLTGNFKLQTSINNPKIPIIGY